MRTTKAGRGENARRVFNIFRQGYGTKLAVVVKRMQSSNPNVSKCQLIATTRWGEPLIVAESNFGVEGCIQEFLGSMGVTSIPSYHAQNFNAWLHKTFGCRVTYDDGLVIMFER